MKDIKIDFSDLGFLVGIFVLIILFTDTSNGLDLLDVIVERIHDGSN